MLSRQKMCRVVPGALLAAGLLSIAVSGCSGGAESAGDGRDSMGEQASTTKGSDASTARGVDEDLSATLMAKALRVHTMSEDAVNRQAGDCMAGAGFTYTPPLASGYADIPPPRPWRPQTAESWLHSGDESAAADTQPASTTTPEYGQALWGNYVESWDAETEDTVGFAGQNLGGDIYDGCLPTAQAEIIGGGDPKKSFRVVELLDMIQDVEWQTYEAMLSDPEFSSAADAWQTCMKGHGYQIPAEAQGLFVISDRLGSADEEVAVQRYNDCLAETGATEVGDRLYPPARQEVEARLIGDGQELEAELDAIAERSNDALSE